MSPTNLSGRFFSDAGSRFIPEYASKILDDGSVQLTVVKQHDLDADIQSHAQSCDIHTIMKRFANGDVGALSRAQGFYGDVSGAPKSYAEILQRVQDGQHLFDSLGSDVRAKFGNDFNKFFASIGTDDWFSALGLSPESGTAAAGGSDVVSPDSGAEAT